METQENTLKTEENPLIDQLQRLQADFINYRNRTEKEKQLTIDATKDKLLLSFLEVKDNFERIPKADKGIELIYNQLCKIFQTENVEEITETTYNPELHEAIATAVGEQDAIIQVTRKGYKRNGKVIRPTQIILGRKEQTHNEQTEPIKQDQGNVA